MKETSIRSAFLGERPDEIHLKSLVFLNQRVILFI